MTLIYLACAWLLGIYLGSLLYWPAATVLVAAAACAASAVALRKRPALLLVCMCLCALFLGLWRYDLARPILTPGPLAAYNDGDEVAFRGLVMNEPVPRDRWINLQVSVYELKTEDAWMPMHGQVLVQVPSYEPYRYGDEVEVIGKLQTPANLVTFAYRAYLARQGIHSLLRYPKIALLARDRGQPLLAWLYGWKRRTQGVIAQILPEPEAALLTGILLGSDEGIPSTLMEQFRAAGIAHIIAISGFNIAIISAALVKVFSRFLQRYVALVAAVGAIALYTILVGADPPVVRAALMGSLTALALIVGRRSDTLISLFVAGWAMTAWQPFMLWEIGFQLSFGASLGLILYSARLRKWTESVLHRFLPAELSTRLLGFLSDTLLVTLAAQITTLPLILSYFHQFSPMSIIANLLIVPMQPAIVYLGSTAALLGLVSIHLGRWLGWVAWLFLTYTVRVAEVMARWVGRAGAVSDVPPAVPLAYYTLLALLTFDSLHVWLALQDMGRRLRTGTAYKTLFAALALILILAWTAAASLPDGRLHVTFLDVGQGDAILMQTPTGRRVLIDGGPSPTALLTALGRRLPFWDRRIDVVLLSHPHDDHLIGLLPVLERYRVSQVLVSHAACDSQACERWQQLLRERNIPVLTVEQPLQADLGDGPMLCVLPAQTKDSSGEDCFALVARLSWQNASFLFTSDVEAEELVELLQAGFPLTCTVLKVPHHGSEGSLDTDLLATIHPGLAVISAGAGNQFGHPAPSTLQTLDQAGIPTLRTDQVGDIEILVNGNMYTVKTRRMQTK